MKVKIEQMFFIFQLNPVNIPVWTGMSYISIPVLLNQNRNFEMPFRFAWTGIPVPFRISAGNFRSGRTLGPRCMVTQVLDRI